MRTEENNEVASAEMETSINAIRRAGGEFVATLRRLNSDSLKAGRTVPTTEMKSLVVDSLLTLCLALDEHTKDPALDQTALIRELQETIGPLIFRSRPFWHANFKPYGYAGDFAVIEQIYAMEAGTGEDPVQPCVVNCLDFAFSQLPCADALWRRRHWLKDVLLSESRMRDYSLDILDVACGGARYIRDFLESAPRIEDINLVLLDQDPSAMAYVRTVQLGSFADNLTLINERISNIQTATSGREFDVVVSAGLFDYLDQDAASRLIAYLYSTLKPEGVLAITNYSSADRVSAVATGWLVNWPLILRSEQEMLSIFPQGTDLSLESVGNDTLWFALCRKPN